MAIVGRTAEIAELESCYESDQSEFVAVYGRRRVGKTFLVRETFHSRISFQVTGIANSTIRTQLNRFSHALQQHGGPSSQPHDWLEAFDLLSDHLSTLPGKKVVFLDELPWLDTPRSGFLPALEWFWNGWASNRNDILLIVCGSATSWVVKKLFRNTGGLHNRVTRQIRLLPFSLAECEAYYSDRKISMSVADMLESYMVFGGIPYYLSLFSRSLSLTQNIDRLCFTETGPLRDEFDNLYHSLFRNADRHIAVVKALASKTKGLTRTEVGSLSKVGEGGALTRALDDLRQSGFVRAYQSYGRNSRGTLYQLIDFFTLFSLRFLEAPLHQGQWESFMPTPAHSAWAGNAFEQVCQWHLPQLKAALGISGVATTVSAWRSQTWEPGAQVDLVIDRADRVINLCEMKFSIGPFLITKNTAENLRNKRAAFIGETHTRKAVQTTLVTPFGVARNKYSDEISSQITAEDLFQPTRTSWR